MRKWQCVVCGFIYDEALGLPERARPLPPPPDHVAGARIDVVVPVRFTLKR